MARVTVTGRASRDLELRFLPSGVAVGTVDIAENHRRKDGDQWVDDGTSWYQVTIWRAKAEAAAERVRKGDLVMVTGDLRVKEFEGRDGTKGKSVEITADDIAIVVQPERGARPARTAAPAEDPWATQGGPGW